MGKELVVLQNCKSVSNTEELFRINDFCDEIFKPKNKKKFSLVSKLRYIEKINPYENSTLGLLQIEEHLRDEKLRNLILKLAEAIDKDSAQDIKNLKAKYGNCAEFVKAKKFLEEKCQETWNVFDNKKIKLEIPKNAMKALGITNQPSLDFLFENSLKYFEKDNSTTTVDIIKSTLENSNINYSFDDISKYLKTAHQKQIFEYNSNTIRFLALYTNFDKDKLNNLDISETQIKKLFKRLTLKEKFNCLLRYYLKYSY